MAIGSVYVSSGVARLCAMAPDGLAEASCHSLIHLGPNGCRIGREVPVRRPLFDPAYRVMEFDRTHLTLEKQIDVTTAAATVRAPHLFALLLGQLRQDLAARSGIVVSHLILPEPIGASRHYREQAAQSAELAGMRIHGVVKESLAACRYYVGASGGQEPQTVMVIQYGTDSASVSLLVRRDRDYRAVSEQLDASSADPVRQMMLRLVIAEASRRHGIDFSAKEYREEAIRIANRLRLELHDCRASRVRIVDWLQDYQVEIHLQREHFCRLIEPIVRNSLQTADTCLSRAGLSWAGVDRIVLLGELAKWPVVSDSICAHSGKRAECVSSRHADAAIPAGALLLATERIVETRSSPFALGIRVTNWNAGLEPTDRYFIEPGAHLPATSYEQCFTRHHSQNAMLLQILRKDAKGEVVNLGEIQYDLAAGTRRGYPVEIGMSLKMTNLLTVTIRDLVLGIVEEHHFDPYCVHHPTLSDRQLIRRCRAVL